MKISRVLIAPMIVAGLGACAQQDPYGNPYGYAAAPYGYGYGAAPYGGGTGFGGMTSGTAVGTVGGALAGGLLGSQIGSGRGQLAATAGGVLLGAMLGGQMGRSLEQRNQTAAAQAESRALAANAPITWNDPAGNVYGTVTPIRTWQSGGQYCREYVHTVYIGGRAEEARGTACQQPGGGWQIMG